MSTNYNGNPSVGNTVKVLPFSTNYASMNITAIREIAKRLKGLDLSSEAKGETKNFLTLGSFKREKTTLEQCDLILRHFVYGFLVIVHSEHSANLICSLDKAEFSVFECLQQVDTLLFTGRVDDWRWLIRNRNNELSDEVVLSCLNQIQNELEKQGLSFLFKGLVKKPCSINGNKYYTLE